MRHYYFIINQQSGTAKQEDLDKLSDQIRSVCETEMIIPVIDMVNGGELETKVRLAIEKSPDAIVVGGGDGSINTAADLICGTGISLGILPLGTFNLAARDLGIPIGITEALDCLRLAKPKDSSMLRIEGKACLCVTMLGFYPRILKKMEQYRDRRWWVKAWKISNLCVVNFAKAPSYFVTTDHGEDKHYRRTYMIIIVPGTYQDTLGVIPEMMKEKNGEATIYYFKHKSRIQMLLGMLSYVMGNMRHDSGIESQQFSHTVLNFKKYKKLNAVIDGETMKLDSPIDLGFSPEVLSILAPEDH